MVVANFINPNPPVPLIPVIIQGEDVVLPDLQLSDPLNGLPTDLTAATSLQARFQKADGTVDTATVVSVVGAPTAGRLSLALAAANTGNLATSPLAGYTSFEISYMQGGLETIVQVLNAIQISARLFS